MAGSSEPCLQKRSGAGKREERQADRRREQRDEPERLSLLGRPAKISRNFDRQAGERGAQQAQMKRNGPAKGQIAR